MVGIYDSKPKALFWVAQLIYLEYKLQADHLKIVRNLKQINLEKKSYFKIFSDRKNLDHNWIIIKISKLKRVDHERVRFILPRLARYNLNFNEINFNKFILGQLHFGSTEEKFENQGTVIGRKSQAGQMPTR